MEKPFLSTLGTNLHNKSLEAPKSLTSPFLKKTCEFSKTPELLNARSFLKPQKTSTFLMFQELKRLEEEFDLKNSTFNFKYSGDYENELSKNAEIKIAERFLEEIISCLQFFEKRIGKVINKAWNTYLIATNKGVKKKADEGPFEKSIEKVLSKDAEIQVVEDLSVLNNEEYLKYIWTLNKAIGRIDRMNHEKLVKKLSKLVDKLSEIDSNVSFESEEFVFKLEEKKNVVAEPVLDSIPETKLEIPKKLRALPVILTSKETQTASATDSISSETLITLINERDRIIYQLRESINKLTKSEENWKSKLNGAESELISCKQTLKNLQDTTLNNIKDSESILQIERQNTEVLKKDLKKSEKIEFELVTTKQMLKESTNIIGKVNEKISKLNEEIEELHRKISLMQVEKKQLEEKFEEIKFSRMNSQNFRKIEKSKSPTGNKQNFFMDYSNSSKAKNNESRIISFSSYADKSGNETWSKSETPINAEKSYFKQKAPTPKNDSIHRATSLERPKSRIIREMFEELSSVNEKQLRSKILRKNNIFTILKIPKEEFLSYSKLVRMELFECLYEHKSKCGPFCEHLKRAEMIRSRERGKLYPLKKCNL